MLCSIGRSFATHLNAKHGISVVAKDRKQILVQCFANESSYFLSNQVPLPALDFVPILDGFKCAQCNHYFLKESSARKHAQNSHVNISIVPCKVQTLCSDSAACRTYFGVESQEQGGCESSTAGSSSLNIASVVEKNHAACIAQWGYPANRFSQRGKSVLHHNGLGKKNLEKSKTD
eukprot:Em0023g861a